jgi:hypothetical protein
VPRAGPSSHSEFAARRLSWRQAGGRRERPGHAGPGASRGAVACPVSQQAGRDRASGDWPRPAHSSSRPFW